MKVYLVWEHFYYEAPELKKIFISRSLAEEYIDVLKNENGKKHYNEIYEKYTIEEKEIIGEIR